MYVYKKVPVNLTDFHASLWAGRGQNTVCLWQLYKKVSSKTTSAEPGEAYASFSHSLSGIEMARQIMSNKTLLCAARLSLHPL